MLEEIARIPGVHEVLALAVPEVFWAVGQLYDSFAQVSDEEVGRVLRSARQPPPAGRAERG
jgi:predicted phosphoribosyltransferase